MGAMIPEAMELAVQIVRLVDDGQPAIVECEFADADGNRHTFIDKIPIFELGDAGSAYPRPGAVRCELVKRSRDAQQRDLVTITTADPDSIESIGGLSEFVVLSDQVSASQTEGICQRGWTRESLYTRGRSH